MALCDPEPPALVEAVWTAVRRGADYVVADPGDAGAGEELATDLARLAHRLPQRGGGLAVVERPGIRAALHAVGVADVEVLATAEEALAQVHGRLGPVTNGVSVRPRRPRAMAPPRPAPAPSAVDAAAPEPAAPPALV